MSQSPPDNLRALLAAINRNHGTSFRETQAAIGGESGSTRVVLDHRGQAHLLKWSASDGFRLENAIAITAELAHRRYPLASYVLTGSNFGLRWTIRPIVQGRPMGALDARSLAQVADLNEMQAGAGASLLSDWPSLVVKSLSEGFQEWCVLDTLRTYSTETAEMLSEMQDYARTSERLRVEQRDAVHFDFTSQNILVDAGEIAAVIDWEGCLAGDRAFDLATMLFYSYDQPEARARLSERLRDIAVAEVAALYLSHMVVRQLDWSIRKHGATIIEQYLGIARHVLRDLRAI